MDPTVDETIEDRFDAYLDDLIELVAQPSISATGEGVRECARHERQLCLEYGFDEAEIVETAGHPSVLAHAYVDNDPDNDAPTALVYGHYDVQPVDREQWTSPRSSRRFASRTARSSCTVAVPSTTRASTSPTPVPSGRFVTPRGCRATSP
ncbi:hypothetical protein [Halolamina pelagica]|uniref:hypothetical protein n=1 Tax=Halolamina pelagica TaxID=699431 RepID=UPI001EFB54FB|nr:hypothetical protein [Halolamina pelagica]